ncbi:hypothetical protein MK489_05605 [Myxococcota bacterium]|nr:hypothetical protein [Myxococcota bacterium]
MPQNPCRATSARVPRTSLSLLAGTWMGLALVVAGFTAQPARGQIDEAEQVEAWTQMFGSERWSFSTGVHYISGDYGYPDDTTILYVPLGAKLDLYPFTVRLTVPYLRMEGPSNVLPDNTQISGPEGNVTTRNGLGEILGSVSYFYDPKSEIVPWIEFTFRTTFPTQTEEDLGTGDFAFSTQVDLFDRWGEFTPILTFGRKFFLNELLDDRFYTSVGGLYEISESVDIGLFYDWYQSSSRTNPLDAHELVPYLSYDVSKSVSIAPYGVIGLSKGSADFGVGLSFTLRL